MIIPVCTQCNYGAVIDQQSHCGKEKCYSYLTKCIADQALADYLDRIRGESSTEGVIASHAMSSMDNVIRP